MNQFIFEIKWYNKYEGSEFTEYGATIAVTYKEAMENIVDDYGDEETIISIRLTNYDEGKTISLSKEQYEDFLDGFNL